METIEKTAIHATETHEQQYKAEQILRIMVETMFFTFVQQANCDIGVIVRD